MNRPSDFWLDRALAYLGRVLMVLIFLAAVVIVAWKVGRLL